jgi:hypothetical protein
MAQKIISMTPRKPAFFEVELQEQHLVFHSFEEIERWINQERDFFNWFQQNEDLGAAFNNLRDNYRNGIAGLFKRLQEWRLEPENENRSQALFNQFTNFYGNSQVVLSNHPFAVITKDVSEKMGPRPAAGAFALLLGTPCVVNFETLRGIIAATLSRDGIVPKSPELVAKAIQKLNANANTEARRREENWKDLSTEAKQSLAENQQSSTSKIDALQKQAEDFLGRFTQDGDAAVQSIKATEASYKEQMKLQAPVDYWESKADAHRAAIWWSRLNIVLFATIGTLSLLGILVWLSILATDIAVGKPSNDAAVYLKFAAIGAILTTIVFWVGRVLLRIYLSDRHLLTDAEERVAMIKTYLALKNDGKVEATERGLVLAPIFRSAADGIVKEEGPDASLAGILARAIDIRGKS